MRISNTFITAILACLIVMSFPMTDSSMIDTPAEQYDAIQDVNQANTDLSGIRVALYESYYSSLDSRVEESRTALYNMLSWMNATVEIINRTDIELGALWAFEVFVIPEGLGPNIESNLGTDGLEAIRAWVKAGGSYIGVRGSSSIAVTDGNFEGRHESFRLGLINGTSVGMPDLGYIVVTPLEINQECTGPDLSTMPSQLNVLFRTGRYFEPDPGQEVICIANYSYNNKPAMIASNYGEGNVFISSPQFEYEENNDLDGTTYMDRYSDEDSEWPLIMNIIQWQVDSSPTVMNTTTWGLTTTTNATVIEPLTFPTELVLTGTAIGICLIALVIFFKRR
ncbi:MAG: hypothetical protein GF411_05875 [Candidatus Lokiarchaeota archaeon]|nr:hypothetical protein [Candidatus Lokiarchaeota archaeon]